MPSATSPDNIRYPLPGDVVGEVEGWLKQLANDQQRALDAHFNSSNTSNVNWNNLKTSGTVAVSGSGQQNAPDGSGSGTWQLLVASAGQIGAMQIAVRATDDGGISFLGAVWARAMKPNGTWYPWTMIGGDTGWKNFNLASPFGPSEVTGPLQWRVKNGVVYFRGGVSAGSHFTTGNEYAPVTAVNEMPEWARPDFTLYFPVPATNGRLATMRVADDGSVAVNYNGSDSGLIWIGSGNSYPVGN